MKPGPSEAALGLVYRALLAVAADVQNDPSQLGAQLAARLQLACAIPQTEAWRQEIDAFLAPLSAAPLLRLTTPSVAQIEWAPANARVLSAPAPIDPGLCGICASRAVLIGSEAVEDGGVGNAVNYRRAWCVDLDGMELSIELRVPARLDHGLAAGGIELRESLLSPCGRFLLLVYGRGARETKAPGCVLLRDLSGTEAATKEIVLSDRTGWLLAGSAGVVLERDGWIELIDYANARSQARFEAFVGCDDPPGPDEAMQLAISEDGARLLCIGGVTKQLRPTPLGNIWEVELADHVAEFVLPSDRSGIERVGNAIALPNAAMPGRVVEERPAPGSRPWSSWRLGAEQTVRLGPTEFHLASGPVLMTEHLDHADGNATEEARQVHALKSRRAHLRLREAGDALELLEVFEQHLVCRPLPLAEAPIAYPVSDDEALERVGPSIRVPRERFPGFPEGHRLVSHAIVRSLLATDGAVIAEPLAALPDCRIGDLLPAGGQAINGIALGHGTHDWLVLVDLQRYDAVSMPPSIHVPPVWRKLKGVQQGQWRRAGHPAVEVLGFRPIDSEATFARLAGDAGSAAVVIDDEVVLSFPTHGDSTAATWHAQMPSRSFATRRMLRPELIPLCTDRVLLLRACEPLETAALVAERGRATAQALDLGVAATGIDRGTHVIRWLISPDRSLLGAVLGPDALAKLHSEPQLPIAFGDPHGERRRLLTWWLRNRFARGLLLFEVATGATIPLSRLFALQRADAFGLNDEDGLLDINRNPVQPSELLLAQARGRAVEVSRVHMRARTPSPERLARFSLPERPRDLLWFGDGRHIAVADQAGVLHVLRFEPGGEGSTAA